MDYISPIKRTIKIDNLRMRIAELISMLHPSSELSTNPAPHRKLRIGTIRSSLTVEGNALSEYIVTAILDSKQVLGPPKDALEVQSAYRVMGLSRNWIRAARKTYCACIV